MSLKSWSWVPSVYFAEGVPYALIATVSVILLKDLRMSNRELAMWTSLFTLPWVLKPLWAPVLDMAWTKKGWIVAMELVMGAGFLLCGGSLTVFGSGISLMILMLLLAFASATHDAAADGFYLIGLDFHEQAYFTGVRSTAYRIAMVAAQGVLVMIVGWMQLRSLSVSHAWATGLAGAGALMFLIGAWHGRTLPAVETAAVRPALDRIFQDFADAFVSFFQKKNVGFALAFILFYRLGESQLVRLAAPFMLESRARGGLGLHVGSQGFLYGTIGVICLLAGGVLGGWLISRDGIGKWMWPMAAAINLPDFVYVYLAIVRPDSLWIAGSAVALEQFGYGFGFTLYMIFMVAFASDSGKFKTAHFALMTGFMALGMMLPGMASGWVQEKIGNYPGFFWYVMICTIPGFLVTALVTKTVSPAFGIRR